MEVLILQYKKIFLIMILLELIQQVRLKMEPIQIRHKRLNLSIKVTLWAMMGKYMLPILTKKA